MKIAVYTGLGTTGETVRHVKFFLKDMFKNPQVVDLTGQNIQKGELDASFALFVVPGGPSTLMMNDIQEAGCAVIRSYVKNGGNYLGFCGGAYLACRRVIFKALKPKEQRINRMHHLQFFQGLKSGPINETYSDTNNSGFEFCELNFEGTDQMLNAYLNGGGYFSGAAGVPYTQVLARYSNYENKPAIVLCQRGLGKALLCSPHFEYTPKLMQIDEYVLKEHIQAFEKQNLQRLNMWKKLLSHLNLEQKEAA